MGVIVLTRGVVVLVGRSRWDNCPWGIIVPGIVVPGVVVPGVVVPGVVVLSPPCHNRHFYSHAIHSVTSDNITINSHVTNTSSNHNVRIMPQSSGIRLFTHVVDVTVHKPVLTSVSVDPVFSALYRDAVDVHLGFVVKTYEGHIDQSPQHTADVRANDGNPEPFVVSESKIKWLKNNHIIR